MEMISVPSARQSSDKTIQKKRNGHFFSCNTDSFFQPKLTIGPIDNPYEREADDVADKVMRMNDSDEDRLQPKISLVGVQRTCAECEEEQLQKKAAQG